MDDKKCFVFCIGGTGLRVMKSALMMMSAGIETNGYTIVPVIIDPHVELSERGCLNVMIDRYVELHDSAWRLTNPKHGFFVSNIRSLDKIAGETTTEKISNEEHRTFRQFINLDNINSNDINQYIVESLFSSKNLDDSLDVGFKGNPNVGTVVLGEQFSSMGEIELFKKSVNDDDRVFIINSIFGGTGASGAPLLQKIIRASSDNPKLQKAVTGCITVLPYFNLGDAKKHHSDIDSSTFLTKTRSALSYYSTSIYPDYQYYVGEINMKGNYENDEQKQENPANFIELTAASSLFHFLQQVIPAQRGKTVTFMREINDDVNVLDIDSMGESFSDAVKCISDGHLLTLLSQKIPEERWFPLQVTRKLDKAFYDDNEFKKLVEWQNLFEEWRLQLEKSERSFSPLSSNDINLKNLVKNRVFDMEDISYLYLQMLNAMHTNMAKDHTLLGTFLTYSYSAIDKYTSKIVKK